MFKGKEESHFKSLALNQMLDMIKLSEEGMSKAEIGWNLEFLHQTVGQVANAKEIQSMTPVNTNDKKAKQLYYWFGDSFSGLNTRSNQTRHSFKPKPKLEPGPNSFQFYESWELRKV